MSDDSKTGSKVHYICQTYVEKKGAGRGPAGLQIGKQLQFSTAAQAQERAERESRSDACVGADAYMIIEDADSGEVSAPEFIARFGIYPDDDNS